MSETLAPPIRTLSFLTEHGDNTYGWEAKDDEWVIPMIQRKMDEGYVFWIVQRNPMREVRLRRPEESLRERSIIIKDNDARILFEQGRIGVVSQTPEEDAATSERLRRATSAVDAAANDTVAHRPPRGG
jgi:hypothetical protein